MNAKVATSSGWSRNAWLALALLAPLAAGVFTTLQLTSLWREDAELGAERRLTELLDATLSTLKDAETGQRGYLLTANRAHLEPYAAALAALPAQMKALEASVDALQPMHLDTVAELKVLIDMKTDDLAQAIALTDSGDQAAALAVMNKELGKRAMDGIRLLVARLRTSVDAEAAERQTSRGVLESRTAYGVGITLASALLLITLLWQSQLSAHRARRRLQAEIDGRNTAEASLAESDQSLAATLASIGAGFIATDRAGRVTRMNAVAERVTGWAQADARGHEVSEVFEQAEQGAQAGLANPIDAMLRKGLTVDARVDAVAVSRSGERTTLEINTALTHTDDGAVRGLAMVFRDVTHQMRAEAESNRLAALVESSYDAIIGTTFDGRITNWNAAAQGMFGYRADEAIGHSIQMLMPPGQPSEDSRMRDDLEHGVRIPAFDAVRRTKDDRLFDASVTLSPIRDEHGRIVGSSKIVRDVTRERRAEAALLTLTQQRAAAEARLEVERLEAENRQITEATRLKSLFLANMSHELRTPLNAIIGFADLLHSGAVPADSQKHGLFLGHIAQSGRHLLQLINDVLDLSKVESGKFEFFPEPVNPAALVQEVADIMHTALARKKLRLTTLIDPSLTDLVVDPARLKQVLYNYLSNAVKFTPDGGSIKVRALPEGALRFRIEVEDNGIGIAAVNQPRLFNEFQQLDAGHSKQHQGTGLGLALTRRLVQAQGGTVGVRSTPGHGSVFHLVLDRVTQVALAAHEGDAAAAAAAPTAAPAADAPAGASPAERQGEAPWAHRLLVLDDDEDHRTRIAHELAGAGFEVDTPATHEQVLQHAGGPAYDGIAIHLTNARLGRLSTLESLRNQAPPRTPPVVCMSLPADPGPAVSFAIADVLSKPIDAREVLASLARFRLPPPGRPNVLVIDDDPIALDLMRAALRGIGVESVCLTSGREALQRIEALRPDAVVLDLMMPELDGFEVLDALRKMPAAQDTPVFIWTSMLLTDDEYARLARSAQAVSSKGGGALEATLRALRRWRAPARHPAE